MSSFTQHTTNCLDIAAEVENKILREKKILKAFQNIAKKIEHFKIDFKTEPSV